MKAQAVIEFPPSVVIKVIGNANYRADYDPVYDYSNFLMKVAHQTFIVHQKTKKVAVVSARDFIFVLHLNKVSLGILTHSLLMEPYMLSCFQSTGMN